MAALVAGRTSRKSGAQKALSHKSRKLAPWSSRELSFTRILSSVQLGQEATPTLKWSENQRDKRAVEGGGPPSPPLIGLTKSILRCPPPGGWLK